MRPFVVLAVLAALLLVLATAAPAGAEVTSLPGWDAALPSKMYSGYVNLESDNAEKSYFYLFAVSWNATVAANGPLQLWLNGGPGCSSLTGFLTEHGVFHPQKNLSLALNPYSWAQTSNVIYLESPAGVGFSQCKAHSSGGCTFNDARTAADNYAFLEGWIQLYPEWANRKFIVSGESYAGHYTTQLAQLLIHKPIKGLNFSGLIVGNPSTDQTIDQASINKYLETHAITRLDGVEANGNYPLNPYDILMDTIPICNVVSEMEMVRFPNVWNNWSWTPNHEHHSAKRYVYNTDACYMEWMASWAQQSSAAEALHANMSNGQWQPCGGVNYETGVASVLDIYRDLLANSSIHIMVFSGDVDTVVNFIGTQTWVLSLKLAPVEHKQWYPWFYFRPLNNPYPSYHQLAGFAADFEGSRFRYRTVRGAGHMTGTWQPGPTLALLQQFLELV